MSVLVLDVGTSSVRAAIVREDASVEHVFSAPLRLERPRAGIVEFDAAALASSTLEVARRALERAGTVAGVGIAAQRASTILWARASGTPVGPGIGWEDLRTTGQCLALQAQGLRLSPNQSATKLAYLLQQSDLSPDALCFGTVESWIAWTLSAGEIHATDASNAALTGLVTLDGARWDKATLAALAIPEAILPRIVDSTGVLGPCSALPGAPPLAGLVGDQQASLIGQNRLRPGEAKLTFGTGGMLDAIAGETRPEIAIRGESGTFPIVAWRENGRLNWGLEAVMLTAGSCITWLCEGLGILSSPAESDVVAGSVRDSGGVVFVPALSGLGAPMWDFGARGVLLGLSAATTRAEVVHAVLEGIAQRGADLLEAVEDDLGTTLETLSVDGGMSANATFVALVARATQRPIALAAVLESTTLGAGFLAGSATGVWASLAEACANARVRETLEPGRPLDRARWLELRERARQTVPALSALRF